MKKADCNKSVVTGEAGFILVTTLIILVVLVVFISAMTFLMSHESKWVVSHKKKVTASQLAEAGANRGVWKLNESSSVWGSLETGTITGYNNDVVYTDVEGGSYKILIVSMGNKNQRKIIATGRDRSGNETRVVEIEMSKATITSSVTSPNIVFGGSCDVHWGPMSSLTNMTLSGSADNYFPRKYARGSIYPRDTNPAQPNTDGVEYWAYYNVPTPPNPDLQHYFNKKDEYYTGFADLKGMTVAYGSDDKIYYCEQDAQLKISYLKGTLIVLGNLHLSGNGKGNYAADVPVNAWREYATIDTAAVGQYFGDAGYQEVDETYTIDKVAFEGYVYVGGNLSSSGTPAVNGVIVVNGVTSGVGNLAIYYNSNIALNIETTETTATRTSWKELPGQW